MERLERVLVQQGYSNTRGFYSRTTKEGHVQSEKVWSALAQENPIDAAAATNSTDWYAKYPHVIEQEIQDEEKLALDAGCGYGRVAIPLLRGRRKLKLIGVDASPVMLNTFSHLVETESAIPLKQRLILLHSPINQLPFPEATFDYIYSCAVLLHNPYRDVRDILDEFNRLLKPTGKLILAGSFPNVFNLEGLQNYIYSSWLIPADANGPVRAYTRHKIKRLFVDWNEVQILPKGVTVLPRQIAKIPLPLGPCVRRVNGWFEEKNFRVLPRSSLFIKYFDVVAQK